jgi:hypothetical protein
MFLSGEVCSSASSGFRVERCGFKWPSLMGQKSAEVIVPTGILLVVGKG